MKIITYIRIVRRSKNQVGIMLYDCNGVYNGQYWILKLKNLEYNNSL